MLFNINVFDYRLMCTFVQLKATFLSAPILLKKLKILLLEIRAVLSSVCNCFGLGCGVKAGLCFDCF